MTIIDHSFVCANCGVENRVLEPRPVYWVHTDYLNPIYVPGRRHFVITPAPERSPMSESDPIIAYVWDGEKDHAPRYAQAWQTSGGENLIGPYATCAATGPRRCFSPVRAGDVWPGKPARKPTEGEKIAGLYFLPSIAQAHLAGDIDAALDAARAGK